MGASARLFDSSSPSRGILEPEHVQVGILQPVRQFRVMVHCIPLHGSPLGFAPISAHGVRHGPSDKRQNDKRGGGQDQGLQPNAIGQPD